MSCWRRTRRGWGTRRCGGGRRSWRCHCSPEAERKRKEKATRRKARVEKFLEKSGNYALAVREMPVEEILASEAHIRGLAAYLRRHGVKLGQREAEVMVYLELTQGRDPLDRIPPERRDHAVRRGPAPHGDSVATAGGGSMAAATIASVTACSNQARRR